ncbi:MAG: DUF2817 domain-containing protein [Planctomycetota bacterium]
MATIARLAPWFLCGCVLPRPIDRSAVPQPAAVPAPGPVDAAAAVPGAVGPAPPSALASSVQGRPILVRQVGWGPRRVVWIGGIHGDEREGQRATAELPEALAERGLLDAVTVTIVDDVNPDGSAAATRGNAQGVDLNRNFPAGSFRASARHGAAPLDQPEARALHDLLLRLRPELVLVAHSARQGPFINWDGPADAAAERFAARSGYPVVLSDRLHPTPGSLGSWYGRDLGVPVLTLEYRRGADPARAWDQTRDAILEAIAGL